MLTTLKHAGRATTTVQYPDVKKELAPRIRGRHRLYETDEGHLLSMVGPKEWGKKIPFKSFVAAVKLLADHTWREE